ncbi:hypothetical protein ACET3X_004652 [Alternaria dauci]|uniref:Uncharacterized protein n=1 Tax=Alternaria dauci TaxID=48095 RepID=A0ABR3UNJ9_9PLEO
MMVFEYVVGKQIWPRLSSSDNAFQQQSLTEYDRADPDACEQFLDGGWYNGISTGVYPVPFGKRQRVVEPAEWNGEAPENSHVGLGATEAEQETVMSLLVVNRQVRKEISAVVWGRSTKRFNDLKTFNDIVRCFQIYCTQQELPGHVFAPRDTSVLSSISLSLSNYEYFEFIGYMAERDRYGAIERFYRDERVGGLKLLKGIHTLRRLNLQFQVIQCYHYYNDLWETTIFDPWHGESHNTCQKKLVDIILTLAYEQLRGIQAVTISGHVKKSNLEKWTPLLRDQMLTGEPRERRDLTADVARILATPASEV